MFKTTTALLVTLAFLKSSAQAKLTPEIRQSILEAAAAVPKGNHNNKNNVEAKKDRYIRGLQMGRMMMAKKKKNDNNNGSSGSMSKSMSKSKSSSKRNYYHDPKGTPPPAVEKDCTFIFKYSNIVAFQVSDGSTILDYDQIHDPDGEFLTICTGSRCAGQPKEVVGTASGQCTAGFEDVFEFTIATDDNVADAAALNFEVYCPDITWEGDGTCQALDTVTGVPLVPPPDVLIRGPEVTIENIAESSLVRCRIACTQRF